MKKTAIIGIVILLAMFVVTCDMFLPEGAVEYTDVVYSEDGSKVTLYLDGVGVPKTAAQRAMSTRLSKMAYDFLDVVFLDDSGDVIARAQWELGQPAGISGVVRDEAYGPEKSLLVAGLKSGKTLLGIGEIKEVDNSTAGAPTILSTSTSVTFYVTAVKTGLQAAATAPSDFTPSVIKSFVPTGDTWSKSTYTKLGNSYIPTYPLPEADATTTTTSATYSFDGAAKDYATYLTYAGGSKKIVEPRFPRYMDGGRYRQIAAIIDVRSTVEATYSSYSETVNLVFESIGSGIFSFYIDIPVTVLSTDEGTNAGKLKPIIWHIRTGLGSELYSLDDGVAAGGCVLMTIGEMSLEDWLEIDWTWVED